MHSLQRPDGSIAYAIYGTQGPRIVAIQGAGCVGNTWKPQAEGLADRCQVLVFDNRGIGASVNAAGTPLSIHAMAQDTRALMDHIGWPSAHVLAHSMGGAIAIALAVDDPERVDSLCLMCTGRGPDITRVSPRMAWLGLRTRVGTAAMRRAAFLHMLFTADYLAKVDTAALAESLAPIIGRDLADSPPIIMQQLRALGRYDCMPLLARLQAIRTLVVSAESDPVAPPALGRALATGIAGARYELLNHASHAITLQEPQRINTLLATFYGV